MKTFHLFSIITLTSVIFLGAGCQQQQAITTSPVTSTVTNTASNTSVANTNESARTTQAFQGNVIAGTTAQYIEFNTADYELAKSQGNIILLDFYANWCPICRAEEPEIKAGFDALTAENVVGFRVNYNDDETDDAEEALAEEYGITYQHTKVIIKNGAVLLKTQEQWDTETFNAELAKVL